MNKGQQFVMSMFSNSKYQKNYCKIHKNRTLWKSKLRQVLSKRRLFSFQHPMTMITVAETAKNDNVNCLFIQFAVLNSCKLALSRGSITTVFYSCCTQLITAVKYSADRVSDCLRSFTIRWDTVVILRLPNGEKPYKTAVYDRAYLTWQNIKNLKHLREKCRLWL